MPLCEKSSSIAWRPNGRKDAEMVKGWYARTVLPRLLDWALDREALAAHRRRQLAPAHGMVLEIGFGTGLNIPCYPAAVEHLTAVDSNPGMTRYAHERIIGSPLVVVHRIGRAERLPMMNESFDCVVSTLTLCSIPDVAQALKELYRVLKPGGQFLFLEHGLSQDPEVQRWQHRLTPFSKILGDGCHLNRNIPTLITGQGFAVDSLETGYLEEAPKVTGYFYRGIANKR